ncbi:MAG: N-acetyltransferase family protein [Anaerolineaceae bacterium]|nr:N-acetyltransferase family protein [Anaerolineaceae bacterium]
MKRDDWVAVRSIYQEGIDSGNATFETHLPSWEAWDQNHMQTCRFVAARDHHVVGWAALSPVSGRCIYAGVAEVSVYVCTSMRGQGIGKKLLQTLIHNSEQAGIWTLQAGIFPENIASIKLHKSCGFREVGYREHLGQLYGKWRNVVLMERRSKTTGI